MGFNSGFKGLSRTRIDGLNIELLNETVKDDDDYDYDDDDNNNNNNNNNNNKGVYVTILSVAL